MGLHIGWCNKSNIILSACDWKIINFTGKIQYKTCLQGTYTFKIYHYYKNLTLCSMRVSDWHKQSRLTTLYARYCVPDKLTS